MNIQTARLTALLLGLLTLGLFVGSISADSQQAQSPPASVSSVSLSRADGTVTASWNAPSGATKYHVTYNDGSGWQAPVPDHRNIQTTNITFSVDNAKTVVVGVRAGNEHGWSGWVNSAAAGPWTPPNSPPADPPAAVASLTLTRADGTATASWDAPSGATKYHVTYNDGSGWQAPVDDHRNVRTTSITFSVDNAKTVVVGVRAGNEHGWSGWVNSAASGPYTPPPPPTPPGIIVQDADGAALSAISVPEGGEASYQVVLAAAPTEAVEVCIGLAVRDNDDADISFKGEAVDEVSLKLTFTPTNWDTAQTVTLVAAYDSDGLNGARDITHDAREYYSGKVDITATEIDTITSPAAPSGLTATAGDGSVTLIWNDPSDASITGYEYNVNHNDTGTGNLSGWSAWTPIPGSDASTTSHTFSGLTNGREYRYHVRAVNAAGAGPAAPNDAPWFVSATPSATSISVTDVTTTTATLTLANHDGAWYYRASGGSGGASGASAASANNGDCTGPVQGRQATLTGLDPDSSYTITAWADGCGGAAMASGEFVTAQQSGTLSLDRLYATSAVLDFATQGTSHWHYQADVGPHSTACSGRLQVIRDAHVGGLTPLTQYTYRAYTDANCANEVASITFTTLRVDLAVSNLTAGSVTLTPDPAHWPSATGYWLKGTTLAGCEPYTGSASAIPLWPHSQFTFEMHSTSSCNDSPHLGYAEFIGPYATLTATHVSASGATLELGGWTREWYYRRTEPSGDNTCHSKNAGDTTVTLTDLQPDTRYSYWAYRNSNCAAQNSLRSTNAPGITFSTVSMAASEPGATTATITLNGGHHGQPWWYAQTAMNPSWPGGQPFPGNCYYGGTSKSGGASVVVRGLDPGNGNSSKSYTFTAYSDADCSVARAMGSVNADTLWPRLSANTISGGGARLTLGNWGANDPDWHYRVNVVVPGSPNIVLHGAEGCTSVASGALQVDIDSLPPLVGYGAYYIFTAYSASGCHYSKVAASALLGGSYATPALSASAVTQTGATLTIASHPGTWYYQADAGPDATCQGPVQAVTATLAGLSAGTTYTYTAYSDSGCTTQLAAAPAFTTLASLSADNRTDTTARLTISSHSGNWYVKKTAPSPAGDCSSTISGTTHDLSSLTRNTTYTYTAYSDSECTAVVAVATFSTLPSTLSAGSVGPTTATLTIGQHTGNWHLKQTAPSEETCTAGEADHSHALTSLTAGTTYTYTAYSDSTCATVIARHTFNTPLHPPTNVSFSASQNWPVGYSVRVDWKRNGSASGQIGYQIQKYADNAWSGLGTGTHAPTSDSDLWQNGSSFFQPTDARVRATKTVGGVTYYSAWITAN